MSELQITQALCDKMLNEILNTTVLMISII